MAVFRAKYPSLLKKLYPKRITKIASEKAIYLTFDDGPIPEVTPWVLAELKKFNAKATFFCIGENISNHPEVFRQVLDEGHEIGNHTYNHLNGWKTNLSEYLRNTEMADHTISSNLSQTVLSKPSKKLFRPPYGRIKNKQAEKLTKHGYKIVMWDVISGDYDAEFSEERCYQNVIRNATEGSTIVFHDSKKAFKNLREILPWILKHYSEKGWEFRSLTDAL